MAKLRCSNFYCERISITNISLQFIKTEFLLNENMKILVQKRATFLLILASLAFVFTCIGTGGNSWVAKDVTVRLGSVTYESGLWKSCVSGHGGGCSDFTASSAWMRSCRAMVILSCLAILLGVALSLLSFVEQRVKGYMISICCIISAITMAIALIVFLTENEWANKLSYRYSWTFILGWIAVLLSLLSAIWATMMGRFDAS